MIEIRDLIEKATKDAGNELKGNDFEIYKCENHDINGLKKGKQKNINLIYLFFKGKECLKIGQATSFWRILQHYKTYNGKRKNASTLARSLYNDSIKENEDEIISSWIKDNTKLYIIQINNMKNYTNRKIVLNMIEGLLQYKYNPKYEGKSKALCVDD